MKSTKVRLQLVMPQETKEVLDDLQTRTGSASMTETIQRALALLNVITQQMDRGGELFVHYNDGSEAPIIII